MPDRAPANTQASPPTTARLSLGSGMASVSTHEHLRFQLDHALARDAVHAPLDVPLLLRGLRERGLEGLDLRSAAPERRSYLLRPDLGRTLHPESIAATGLRKMERSGERVLFLLADGLSARAVERHGLPLLDAALPLVPHLCSTVPVLQNARVALGDEIGLRFNAQLTVLLLGERPGLSSPDSLGVYITWDPRPGRTDAERNCISNIRGDAGLSYAEAAYRIAHYCREAQRLCATGIALKDPPLRALGPGQDDLLQAGQPQTSRGR